MTRRSTAVVVMTAAVVVAAMSACGPGSSSSSFGGSGDTSSVSTAAPTTAVVTDAESGQNHTDSTSSTVARPWPNNGDCEYMRMQVDPPLDTAAGAFTASPFDLDTIRMFINGSEGNGTDSRFSYVLIAREGEAVPVYAPAPMLLVKMRLKDGEAMQRTRPGGDWDFTFLVSCDVQVRVNHITQPDPAILAAYGYGDEPGTTWTADGQQIDDESKMEPVAEVRFEAGDLIGYTQGTASSNFDYVVGVDGATVCPWEMFDEPIRSSLLAKLGPPPGSPDAGPVPNWPCTGYGDPM